MLCFRHVGSSSGLELPSTLKRWCLAGGDGAMVMHDSSTTESKRWRRAFGKLWPNFPRMEFAIVLSGVVMDAILAASARLTERLPNDNTVSTKWASPFMSLRGAKSMQMMPNMPMAY